MSSAQQLPKKLAQIGEHHSLNITTFPANTFDVFHQGGTITFRGIRKLSLITADAS